MRVGFDSDGVLYDFGNSVRNYLDSIGRTYGWNDGLKEPDNWNFYEYWHMDRAEFVEIVNAGVDAGFIFTGPIRPGAVEAIERVARLGHEIIIITDRSFGSTPAASERNTCEWLAEHGIEYDELVFSPDKTCVPTDIFVEDKISNYDALIAAGTPCYLINRPWNQVPGGDARNRINDVLDYADIVEQVTSMGFTDLTFA